MWLGIVLSVLRGERTREAGDDTRKWVRALGRALISFHIKGFSR